MILENKLYFMSGTYTFEGGDTNAFGTTASASNLVEYMLMRVVDKMYWLELNTSFELDAPISPNVLRSMTAPGNDWRSEGGCYVHRSPYDHFLPL